MIYKTKVDVSSEIRTKHSKQSEHQVNFLNGKPWVYVKKPLGFERLDKSCIISENAIYIFILGKLPAKKN